MTNCQIIRSLAAKLDNNPKCSTEQNSPTMNFVFRKDSGRQICHRSREFKCSLFPILFHRDSGGGAAVRSSEEDSKRSWALAQ